MGSLLDRLRAWWSRDAVELADEETRMSESERDVVEDDYQAHKDDVAVRERLGTTDFESDSKNPGF